MAIPIYERQAGIAPIPDAKMRGTGGPDAYGAGVWRAAEGFADAFRAKAEEFEDASTLEAFNNFKREVMDYHSNPDKGIYNTKMGKDALGAAEQADLYVDNLTEKYAGGMKSPRAAQNFYKMATQVRDRYAQANMDFESRQVDSYRNAEAKATIELGLNDIAANYGDDAAVEGIQAQMMQALELQTRGLGDEAKKLALQEMRNSIATTRVARMLDEDPDAARVWYAANKDQFDAETRAKVDAQIEIYENQEISMGLVRQFGMDEKAGVAHILEHYKGKKRNAILSDYKQRMNELSVSEANEAAALSRRQKQNAEMLYTQYYSKGEMPPPELLQQLNDSGELNMAQTEKFKGMNADMADVKKVEKQVLSEARFQNATGEDVYAEVRRRRGISAEQSTAYFQNLKTGIMSGHATKSDIVFAQSRGWISPNDADRLTKLESKFSAEQKQYMNAERKSFETELGKLSKNGMSIEGLAAARDMFMERVAELDPADPAYREKVGVVKKQALLESFDANTGKMNKNLQSLESGYKQSKFDILDNAYLEQSHRLRSTVQLSGNVVDMANQALVATLPQTKGVGYQMGAKDIGKGKVDCSGLVCKVQGDMMKSINKASGGEIFDKAAQKAVTGASADIIQNVSKVTGWELPNPSVGQLREGMIVGLDADSGTAGGRGYRGIDHVATVIRDPQTGRLAIYESRSGDGVIVSDAASWLQMYRKRGVNAYAVNPMLMAKNVPAATPNVPGRSALGSRFGGEGQQEKKSAMAGGIEQKKAEPKPEPSSEPEASLYGMAEFGDIEVTR